MEELVDPEYHSLAVYIQDHCQVCVTDFCLQGRGQ